MIFKAMLASELEAEPFYLRRISRDQNYWVIQEKLDGHRVLVQIHEGKITPWNREGKPYSRGLPKLVHDAFPIEHMDLNDLWIFDGELIDNVYWLFDLLMMPGKVDIYDPYHKRRSWLEAFYNLDLIDKNHVKLVDEDNCLNLTAKIELYRDAQAEGIILRQTQARYFCGERSEHLRKIKFKKTVDCYVMETRRDSKDNAVVGVFLGDKLVEIGKVSTIGKGEIKPGMVVEVEYLRFTDSERLYQPILKRVRFDSPACQYSQLINPQGC